MRPRPSLPSDLAHLLVDLRDREDPLLLPVLHRAADLGWPPEVLAPVMAISPGSLRRHLGTVNGYDPTDLPPIPLHARRPGDPASAAGTSTDSGAA